MKESAKHDNLKGFVEHWWRMGMWAGGWAGAKGMEGRGVTVVRSGLTMMGGGEVMAESGEREAWVWAGPGSGPAVQLAAG